MPHNVKFNNVSVQFHQAIVKLYSTLTGKKDYVYATVYAMDAHKPWARWKVLLLFGVWIISFVSSILSTVELYIEGNSQAVGLGICCILLAGIVWLNILFGYIFNKGQWERSIRMSKID